MQGCHGSRAFARDGAALDPILPRDVPPPMKVTDPVCGMVIESTRAAGHGTYGGAAVYFCSTACQAQYERTHRPSPK